MPKLVSPKNQPSYKMLFSVPRVIAVMAFALATCVMAAPTAIAAPKSVDDRVKELAENVNKLVLAGKSKEVKKQQDVRCRDATRKRSCGTRRAMRI